MPVGTCPGGQLPLVSVVKGTDVGIHTNLLSDPFTGHHLVESCWSDRGAPVGVISFLKLNLRPLNAPVSITAASVRICLLYGECIRLRIYIIGRQHFAFSNFQPEWNLSFNACCLIMTRPFTWPFNE